MNTSLPSLRPISLEASSPSRNGGRVCFSSSCRTNADVGLVDVGLDDVLLADVGPADVVLVDVALKLDWTEGGTKRIGPSMASEGGVADLPRYFGTKHGAVPRTATRKLSCGSFI
jgi:hypothetical protein